MNDAFNTKTGHARTTMRDHEMSPSAERYAKLKQLFFEAVMLDEENRRRFVDEVCGKDAELSAELESLLEREEMSIPDSPHELTDSAIIRSSLGHGGA